MGKPDLDPMLMKQMDSWGANYNNMDGCSHDSDDDKVDQKIASKDQTLNVPSKMDAPHPKASSDNPGFDKGFWAKAKASTDTTGHGTLSRKLKD